MLFRVLLASLLFVAAPAQSPTHPPGGSPPRFKNGLATDVFPLGVWLQAPENAAAYRRLGINLYVGLYQGPTALQLEALDKAEMRVICHQNQVALAHPGPTIVGWLLGDEPDNAQGRQLTGYKPPIPPAQVVADYERLHRADPTRPVLLNLGQGAAWDGWHGRGERTNHPEDYPQYVKGCDVVSFDIYPVTHPHADVQGKLEFVGRGVQRLIAAGRGKKPVWAIIETSHVSNAKVRPTPEQLRAEVWIAIACGAAGIVYFAHEFAPSFVEAAILKRPDVQQAVTALNAEVQAVADILTTPQLPARVKVATAEDGLVAVRVHEHEGKLHLFAASLHAEPVRAEFDVRGAKDGYVEIVGRTPRLPMKDGGFAEELPGYAIRHYRIAR